MCFRIKLLEKSVPTLDAFSYFGRKKKKHISSQLNSEWLLTDDRNPLHIPVETGLQSAPPVLRMPSAATLCVLAPHPPPPLPLSPHPASTFSLFIYCVEDLNSPKLTCGIDLAHLLPSFFLCPPFVFSSGDFFFLLTSDLLCKLQSKKKKKRINLTEKVKNSRKTRERMVGVESRIRKQDRMPLLSRNEVMRSIW